MNRVNDLAHAVADRLVPCSNRPTTTAPTMWPLRSAPPTKWNGRESAVLESAPFRQETEGKQNRF
jgi:hypothetical protein